MKQPMRKCAVCDVKKHKSINVSEEKFIYYKEKYYHYDCLIKAFNEKSKRKIQLSPEKIIALADDLVIKTKENKIIQDAIDKDRLIYWIYDNYDINVLPSSFFIQLKSINEGTHSKRINTQISNYDLLQIYKKLKTYLDKVNNDNERKGKNFNSMGRVIYDLAIVINNYDEYLKWKAKHKTEVIETQQLQDEIKSKNAIQSSNITAIQRNSTEDSDEIDISALLNELF